MHRYALCGGICYGTHGEDCGGNRHAGEHAVPAAVVSGAFGCLHVVFEVFIVRHKVVGHGEMVDGVAEIVLFGGVVDSEAVVGRGACGEDAYEPSGEFGAFFLDALFKETLEEGFVDEAEDVDCA